MSVVLLAACGGGGNGGEPPTLDPTALPNSPISAASPVAAACNGGNTGGTAYVNAEAEPWAATSPVQSLHVLAAWQQDRWSTGGARAIVSAVSSDGGLSWTRTLQPLSRCGGGSAAGGDYERVTDPWVDIGPDGAAYLMTLAFNGSAFAPSSASAMLVRRSADGGSTWDAPIELVRDDATRFNDKGTLTADPTDAHFVYAVWDRLDPAGNGPTMFARSTDGGQHFEAAREIYTPAVAGGASQTLGNRIVVLASGSAAGTLINLFTRIDVVGNSTVQRLGVVRSHDHGSTWGPPVFIADLLALGTRDPQGGRAVRDGADLASIAVGPDNTLWVVWQDARFSGGLNDAIAMARSSDGGDSWSAPVAINTDLHAQAFTPAVQVRSDGAVAVLHDDLRSDPPDARLWAGAWLLVSTDGGANWTESPVWNPFDLGGAPDSEGLFLGDYQALLAGPTGFLPVLVLSRGDAANRTDVFALPTTPVAAASAHAAIARTPAPVPSFAMRRQAALIERMKSRLPGWPDARTR